MKFITWRAHGALLQNAHCATAASIERLLDRPPAPRRGLTEPYLARIIRDALMFGQAESLYDLRAWVVMHNHVHALFEPRAGLPFISRLFMHLSERDAGRRLWDRTVYQRPVGGEDARYIELHPVRAGLVARPEEWPWSSAYSETPATRHSAPSHLRLHSTCNRTSVGGFRVR